MAIIDFLMPKMGESVMEGTILKWFKSPGEQVELDETILEIGTDKVDTEIPSPHSGIIKEITIKEGEIAQIGQAIAKIEIAGGKKESPIAPVEEMLENKPSIPVTTETAPTIVQVPVTNSTNTENRFYSPLVINIAQKEKIGMEELNLVPGSGKSGRVTKKDILTYIETRSSAPTINKTSTSTQAESKPSTSPTILAPVVDTHTVTKPAISINGEYEIIEMSRMRKMIAERMLDSQKISAHVSSFVEADVTNLIFWRNRWKQHFKEKENAILTLTPIFIEAVVKAIKDYPMMNVSVHNDKIYLKKDINIGLAVALPDGNLIVPVIKNADQLNLVGLTKKMNDLAKRARTGRLNPDELTDGSFTVSNVGSFGNVMGTPIIVQPQVGILALGAVVKKPAVVETPQGDAIAIRHMMFLSHSYDHRVVDGSLGGMFVRRVADHLERFDLDRKI
jgi:2-oxoglutarate dehydrogenase E2 component (dihydrolipoamide succinyltransferase)